MHVHVGVGCTMCLGRDEPAGIQVWTTLSCVSAYGILGGIHVHVGADGTGPELHGVDYIRQGYRTGVPIIYSLS